MRVAAVFLIAACGLAAADLTGIWVGQIPGRNGAMQDIAFRFTQKADKLEGKLYGDYKSTPLLESHLNGSEVTFILVAQEQAGNQINNTRFRFTGRLVDGELELTRERESSTNAGNGGRVQFRENTKQTFRLKRLL